MAGSGLRTLGGPGAAARDLHVAALVGDQGTIERLVRSGADLEGIVDLTTDPDAQPCPATPLMIAAGSGEGADDATVELLLRLGADPRSGARNRNAVTTACTGLGWNHPPGGDAARLTVLLDAGCPLPEGLGRRTGLVAAVAAAGDPDRLAILLDRGCPAEPPSERETDGQPAARYWHQLPLSAAADSGSVTCVELLLAAGADPTRRGAMGETAMWRARTEAMARRLVGAGLSLADTDRVGWSPLVSALDDPDRVRALVAAGADVRGTHDRGYTVFMSAVSAAERSPEVTRLLVAAGADPHAVSDLGFNAWHAAVDVNGEANEPESIRGTFEVLLDLGVDLEHRTNAGVTPLARAVLAGTGAEVEALCEVGADPNALGPSYGGSQPAAPLLFLAISAAVEPTAKTAALLAAGARTGVIDAAGRSPQEYAGWWCDEVAGWDPSEFRDRYLSDVHRCRDLLDDPGTAR